MRCPSLPAVLAASSLFLAACSGSGTGGTVTVLGYTVVIKTAPPLTAPVGTSVTVAFTVTENESDGTSKPASGKSFTVTVTAGGGTINGQTAATLTTAADGSASLTWVIGSVAGAQTVRGSVSATQYLDVNLTATALPATQLAFTTGPSTVAQNGAPLALQPVLQVRDANGQAVAQALVAVTVSLDAGGGTLTGGPLTVNTNASGAAVFSGLTLGGLVGTKTLKFTGTVNGIVTTLTATVGLTAGAATQLALTTTPSTAAAVGIALVQQPIVQLRDVDGNPVAQALVSVTAAIDVGGGTLGGGTLAVSTNATGAAVFTGLAINGSVGNRTLKFTATLNGQNVSVTSGTIAVSLPVVTAVEFAGSSLVKVGQGYGYDVTQHLPGGTVVQHPVTWSILVPGTATITGTGVLGPLLPGNISIVATIDGVAWINVISSYDWVVTNTATTRAVSLTSNVAVTNFSGPPELQTLSFTCNLTTGNFGVSVGFNAIITGGGAVTYTGAGAVTIAETWLESSPLFHLLTYPGSTNTARKNFAQAIATNWAIVFTFDYTFVESQHGVHATGWQLNGIATALAPVLAACPAT